MHILSGFRIGVIIVQAALILLGREAGKSVFIDIHSERVD